MKYLSVILFAGITIASYYSCRSKAATTKESVRLMMLTIPDSPYAVSSFMHDESDPVSLSGIDFLVGEDASPRGDIVVSASSSNTQVVPNTGLIISGTGPVRNLKIQPVAAGYATITIHVSEGNRRTNFILDYAVSQEQTLKGKNWHTGIADASAAIVIDEDYMLVANDETNFLYLYPRHHSGMPVISYDFNQGNILGLTDSLAGKWKEVDVEAGVTSTKDPSIIYWIGSMSNNGLFLDKPNRNRLFAIRVSGKKATAGFVNAGSYNRLRQNLLTWGDSHGYDFSKSAAVGRNPKQADGFNIEGMVFGPDRKTMYIGFRAPLVPVATRTKAVIAPITNFEAWFNKGEPAGDPRIDLPIELDLGGRGIRDIISIPGDNYVIIAGSCGAALTPAVYTWSGKRNDPAVEVTTFELTGLNVEGVIPIYEDGKLSLNKLQVLTDNGNQIYYGDTVIAKNLPAAAFKKFSSVVTESRKPGSAPKKP